MGATGPGEDMRDFSDRWEKAFDRVLTPLEEFIHRQTSGSILLALATISALILANSSLSEWYAHLVHTPVQVSFGDASLEKSLHHWINDGLMAIFFFVVGLELKREFIVGELANPKNAILPIVGAIGGMVVPALLYVMTNYPDGNMAGWGIPMATDIAFAVGVLSLLGARIPATLLTFLIALAIVDDLGAVLVIAIFYTDTINVLALATGGGIFLAMVALKFGGIRHPGPFALLALLLWGALLSSGIHATIAGILGAMTIPVRPKYNADRFVEHIRSLTDRFEQSTVQNPNILTNVEARALLQTLEQGVQKVQAPLQRLERSWHMPVVYLVLPAFAFINAGVVIPADNLGAMFDDTVTLGVILGLLIGKPVGIAGFSYLAIRLGFGRLPRGTDMSQIIGVSFLGGIGFTMSIFVTELAFGGNPGLITNAKLGVLIASIVAGVIGYLLLMASTSRGENSSETTHGEKA